MLEGYNCTVFAYGQTGTGKTYTMSGDLNILGGDLDSNTMVLLGEHAGIIPRVLVELFRWLDGNEGYSVKVSFLELYNERLKDLLASEQSEEENIRIFDNVSASSSIMVKGMEEIYINSAHQGLQLLMDGSIKRKVAATKCNDLSSRSHTVFTITTNITKLDPVSGEQYVKTGKLNLVDLAGSENINRSGAENKRAQEAGLINKSLLTLGRVINALVDHTQHIPYRESKLTRLLQDSLGGKTKTCIIATISPAKISMDETISTLEYATRAKSIKNTPQVNQSMSKDSCINEYVHEIERLRQELKTSRQKDGISITQDQFDLYESNGILVDEQKTKIQNMEEQIQRFKDKYVKQTELNKNLESRLKQNELQTIQLKSQRTQLLSLLENFQSNSNHYIERVTKIHDSNTHLIQQLAQQRSELHNGSITYVKSVTEAMSGISDQQKELSELRNVLQSYNDKFKHVITGIFTELEDKVKDTRKSTLEPLTSMNLRLILDMIGELRDDISTRFEMLKKPRTEDTTKIFKAHQDIIETCFSHINEYCDSMEKVLTTSINQFQAHSLPSSFDIFQDKTKKELDELMNIIKTQKQYAMNLEQQIIEEKKRSKRLNIHIKELQSYFEEFVTPQRQTMFQTIIDMIENSRQKQHEVDMTILNKSQAILSNMDMESNATNEKNLQKLQIQSSNSLNIIDKNLHELPQKFELMYSKEKLSLQDKLADIPLSSSMRKLTEILEKMSSEETSKPVSMAIKDHAQSLETSIFDADAQIKSLVEKLSTMAGRDFTEKRNELQSISQTLDQLYKYILHDYKGNVTQLYETQSDIMSNHCTGVDKIVDSLDVPIKAYSKPKYPPTLSETTINELPEFQIPENVHIFTDLKKDIQNHSHSPNQKSIVDVLSNVPSTPVPIPDQPLPKVLVPKSINSNTKRAHTLPSTFKNKLNKNLALNNLKRRFTEEPTQDHGIEHDKKVKVDTD